MNIATLNYFLYQNLTKFINVNLHVPVTNSWFALSNAKIIHNSVLFSDTGRRFFAIYTESQQKKEVIFSCPLFEDLRD